jgi:5-methylcytosine-specific restriction endonuclease McrA
MARYKTSNGMFIEKKEIDKRVRMAKKIKLSQQLEEFSYNFCTECGRNDDVPLDCSHRVSVDECQKTARSELAWDTNNIDILGRKCHQIRDGLNLKS